MILLINSLKSTKISDSLALYFIHFIYLTYNFKNLKNTYLTIFLNKFYFISNYYILNELIWQEGFLLDFLQKKSTDIWIKKFLIFSAYLFNERLVFDKIIRFYLDLIIWPAHKLFVFEFNNISNTLFITIFFFIFFTFFLFLHLPHIPLLPPPNFKNSEMSTIFSYE